MSMIRLRIRLMMHGVGWKPIDGGTIERIQGLVRTQFLDAV